MNRDLNHLQERLQIRFRDPRLLRQAFTHSSYVNENRGEHLQDNERLEFLGDAVLELAVSEHLYRTFTNRTEGELTKQRAAMVCEPSLVAFAEELEFGAYVLLGKGEEQTGGRNRPALLADVFEAFIGALYLDQGLESARQFLQRHVLSKAAGEDRPSVIDFKTVLQEYVQQHNLGTPDYRIVEERGPAHEKEFVSEVHIDDRFLGAGSGRSKKEAEQQAASQALSRLGVNP